MRITPLLAGLAACSGCALDSNLPDDPEAPGDVDLAATPKTAPTPTLPGRASIWGLTPGAPIASRFWLPHGGEELAELTGPNDRQLVGDFTGAGHDQVLFLNYWGGSRRVVVADFWSNAAAPALPYVEPWGSPLLNGWDDRQAWTKWTEDFSDIYSDDVAIAGDFLHRGHDQVLLVNRQPFGGRVTIIDYATGSPDAAYYEAWGGPGLPDAFSGSNDDFVAGDFLDLGYDQVMLVNTDDVWPGMTRTAIRDFSGGGPWAVVDRYADAYGADAETDLRGRPVTRRVAGDFLGRGYDQVLSLNPTGTGTRVWIHDYVAGAPDVTATPGGTPFQEDYSASVLLDGWHDDNDWLAAGDFAGIGRDQVMFSNRDGINGRVMVADFGAGPVAQSLRFDLWSQPSPLDGWQDDDDLYLAGRFTPHAGDGLLTFNNSVVGQRRDVRAVSTTGQLISLLDSHYTGIIDLDPNATFDLTGNSDIVVRSGISLRGGRRGLGIGALLFRDDISSTSLFLLRGNDISVEELRLRGAAFGRREINQPHQGGIAITVDRTLGIGKDVRVIGCELNEWLGKAIVVGGNKAFGKLTLAEVDPGWPRQGPQNAGWVRIANNFIHHNAMDGAGYGVLVEAGAYATIEGNLFDYNRHAISGAGSPYSGYVARYNYVQEGGFQVCHVIPSFPDQCYWNQHFDMHGLDDSTYGGLGGEYIDISYNFFRGDQTYYLIMTRPAFMLRGTPSLGAYVHHNVWVHDDDDAVRIKGGDDTITNYQVTSNRSNTDYSTSLATGDFDGDGRADVFVGTGTAWYYSSNGLTEWRYLNAASHTARDLAFADLDGDGVTDVISFDPTTYAINYSKSGTAPWAFVTISPQPLSELRFADFNHDGHADIFRTYQWQWWIMDGQTRVWEHVGSASNPITQLRFGEFDAIPGADVASVVGNEWVYSSGARSLWAHLNAKLLSSLSGTVAADFDGDGRTDLAYRTSSEWRFSSGGRTAFSHLRSASSLLPTQYPELEAVMIGNFDAAHPGVEALTFERAPLQTPFFVVWHGLGYEDFERITPRPMR